MGTTASHSAATTTSGSAIIHASCRPFVEAADTWGVGSGASHLVSGHSVEHHALEEELAAFVGRPRAILFSTGYMANLAVAARLAGRGDTILEDRLNHASLLDAGLASGARVARYRHGDVASLRTRLTRVPPGRPCLVMTDGVFSMDGDVAPLAELAAACRDAAADLMVDDAHGFGVLGPGGAGAVAEAGLGLEGVPVLMCTLGKAVGTFGAFVAGSDASGRRAWCSVRAPMSTRRRCRLRRRRRDARLAARHARRAVASRACARARTQVP